MHEDIGCKTSPQQGSETTPVLVLKPVSIHKGLINRNPMFGMAEKIGFFGVAVGTENLPKKQSHAL